MDELTRPQRNADGWTHAFSMRRPSLEGQVEPEVFVIYTKDDMAIDFAYEVKQPRRLSYSATIDSGETGIAE